MNHKIEVFISSDRISKRILEIANEIDKHFKGSDNLILIGLLRGSYMFMSDLSKLIKTPHEIDFITASSYGAGTTSSGDVKILKDLDGDINGKDIIIIEDIIDTGNTLSKVKEILSIRNPASIKICTLLDKPSRREIAVSVDYIGFEIPDEFVVGMGLDLDQKYRHLPFVGKITE